MRSIFIYVYKININAVITIQKTMFSKFLGISKTSIYVNVFDSDDRTKIFIITDYNSIINKKEFVYVFANEY